MVIILYFEVLIAICLIAVEIVMLQRMKKKNEAWLRTLWVRESLMLQKIAEIDERTSEILNCLNY